jgi:GNAT superfamily N-acetyltransferase
MENELRIIETTHRNIMEYGSCGYRNYNTPGIKEKIVWMKERGKEGLKMLTLWSKKDGHQGMIEYIPGEYCWRPVSASGYMFIHCVFVGLLKKYKGKGYATVLLDLCIEDALTENMKGVAAVTRKGSFMIGKAFFEKNGFKVVDHAPPDFDLVVRKFVPSTPDPAFIPNWKKISENFTKGLYIIRAHQCPYTVKNVSEICETAKNKYRIKPSVITLKSHTEAQQVPNPYGIFSILYNGKIIAYHPISNNRFMNIMDKMI